MKKNYFFTVQLYALLFLGFQGSFLSTANSQTNGPDSVGPGQHFFDNARIVRQKPSLYPFRDALSQNENHILTALTSQERKSIEESTDPPAIGVLRDLKEPIRFTLNNTDIPLQGERSVSGGRLARVNDDTLVWTTCIRSEGADMLRIYFSEGNFPAGVKVNLFSKDNYAFTQPELRGILNTDGFYTTTTFADYVFIQVVIPVDVINENLHFIIPKVIHAESRYIPDAAPLDCYQDVNCSYAQSYAHIDELKEATARLYFAEGSSYYLCTGSLLNDVRSTDWQPFLLTAHHCISTQASAVSLEATFDYFTTSCNGATNTNTYIIDGSNLIATNSESDFTLLLLMDNPGGSRFYLGWTTGGVADGAQMHSVHHPSGIPQKYQRVVNDYSPSYNCTGFSTSNFHYTTTIGGQESPGSSGGNIVTDGGYVVGQLYGVCHPTTWSECDYSSYNNMWGRFNVSYNNNNLQCWLNSTTCSSVYMSTNPASSLAFSQLNVGTHQDLNVTVSNNGTVPYYLNLAAGYAYISGTDASQFSIIGSNYRYLSPGTSDIFTIRFTPTSAGLKNATLYIPNNADNISGDKTIALTGTAEPCSDIISLDGGGSINTQTYSKSGTGIWYTSWADPCGWACPGNEQIYSFVAPYTGYYSLEVTSTNSTWLDYMWRSGSCGTTWNCIQDVYYTGTYGSMYWTAGNTYYILTDAESTALTTHTFYIFLNPCLNITTIGGTGSGNSVTYSGGGNGAWYTNTSSPCSYWCPGMEQVYSFVAPYTGYYSIQVTSTTEWYVDYMWSTSCGSTGWNCIHDIYYPGTYGAMYWTAGTTYYILLDDEDNVVGPQTFYINTPDPCLGIIPLACNQAVDFPGGGPGVWNTYTCFYSCPGFEQVYSFVAPTTGQYSIQVNAASSWVDYMWSTSCSSGTWTCISDISIPGQYGSMSWTAGTTYYILLDDEDNSPGIHNFSIVCPALCHDCPTYDFPIYPSTSWQTSSSSIDTYGCKFYRFWAYNGYHYTFKTGCGDGATADYDTYLQLFNAGCTLVTYDDDGCGYPLSKIEWTAGASGYYYLKVRGFSSYFGNYTLAYIMCYAAPAQPGAISGPTTVINGIAEPYSISAVPSATSYTWTYSGSGAISGGGTSIILTPTGSGVLSVVANNSCGSSPASTLSITVLPVNLILQNIAINPGPGVCYEASQTITVAGGGTFFFVPNGASVEFVAGQNILFMPGVLVQNGGYLLGRIATTGDYCVQVPSNPVVNGEEESTGNTNPASLNGDSFFKVFPNPTTGNFTLELSSEPDGTLVKVQIYSILGALIMEKEFYTGKRHELTLNDQKPGLYVLKVIQNNETGMQKIIRQ